MYILNESSVGLQFTISMQKQSIKKMYDLSQSTNEGNVKHIERSANLSRVVLDEVKEINKLNHQWASTLGLKIKELLEKE